MTNTSTRRSHTASNQLKECTAQFQPLNPVSAWSIETRWDKPGVDIVRLYSCCVQAVRVVSIREGVTELGTGTQVVHTLRDVRGGEELLWDYGMSYDRSHYDGR